MSSIDLAIKLHLYVPSMFLERLPLFKEYVLVGLIYLAAAQSAIAEVECHIFFGKSIRLFYLRVNSLLVCESLNYTP
jgi:hypothetical protein